MPKKRDRDPDADPGEPRTAFEAAVARAVTRRYPRDHVNHHITQPLLELAAFWEAVGSDQQQLVLARAASAVQAHPTHITDCAQLRALDFVGGSTLAKLEQILATGTCDALEAFRRDEAPRSISDGQLAHEARGGATRRLFSGVLGVGPATALLLFDRGLRSVEAVDPDAAPAGVHMTPRMRLGFQCYDDITRGRMTAAEADEVLAAVRSALQDLSGGDAGWLVTTVGSYRRTGDAHDLDVLISHPSLPVAGVITALTDLLVQRGFLGGGADEAKQVYEAMRAIHGMWTPDGPPLSVLAATHLPLAVLPLYRHFWPWCRDANRHWREYGSFLWRQEGLNDESGMRKVMLEHNETARSHMDRLDRTFGVWMTAADQRRARVDLIVAPIEQYFFAMAGWTSSKMYNRFLRLWGSARGLKITSHGVFDMRREGRLVPQETKGWVVQSEQDVFTALELPYLRPEDRHCAKV